jgi:deazaflavin-dependent oxidoreductase (nitroreductase family)
MPILGVLHHSGRRSGRIYHTPLGMRRSGDTVVIPRTFGEDAAWYRNTVAAGWAEATYLGRCYRLVNPQVIDYETAAAAFPNYERLQFRLIGINQFVSLRIKEA